MRGGWWQQAVSLRGSVVVETLPKALWFGLWGGAIAFLYKQGFSQVDLPLLSTLIPNLVLGLLLVFRTNTAYERYWDGRKAWGAIVCATRNLGRTLAIGVDAPEPSARAAQIQALYRLAAFALTTKNYLRGDPATAGIPEPFLGEEPLASIPRPPLHLANRLAAYLQSQYREGRLNESQLATAQTTVDDLVASFTACERIQRTPLPLAYSIHLKQLLLLYNLSLPFQVVATFLWLTPIMVAVISFTILGVEAIGLQIEDPFGRDANDLPLDSLCAMLVDEIEALVRELPIL
ncbi:MAG: bestrophin family ion channel [Pseudanabaenaceae cyanobacterium]